MNTKTDEIKEYLRKVENQCFEKSQMLDENERLDDIINNLQIKNNELNDMMSNTMGAQAEEFKQKALNTLTRNKKLTGPIKQQLVSQ